MPVRLDSFMRKERSNSAKWPGFLREMRQMPTTEQTQLLDKAWSEENTVGHHTVSRVQCQDGTGTIECLQVFPGVELFLNSFQAHHCEEKYEIGDPLQINFCFDGRFECSFSERECCILGPGDLSVHHYNENKRRNVISEFPLGYYRGIGIYLDCGQADRWMKSRMRGLDFDFYALKEHLLQSGWYMVQRAAPKCEQLLKELSVLTVEQDITLLRLKVLEFFFWLKREPPADNEIPYYPKKQVELVKQIRDQIVDRQEQYVSLKQLAAQHDLSVTQLQKIFKSLYGVTVYQYIREFRLERAAVRLLKTDDSVTEIAFEAGFTNPGKFAEGFKRRYGMTPTQYRSQEKNKTKME